MKLSESIKRLYKKITSIRGAVEVETDRGWEPVEYVMQTPAQQIYEITTENGLILKCSADHILIDAEGNEMFAKDSVGRKVKTAGGDAEIVQVRTTNEKAELYDLSLGGNRHVYYANEILSHNCVICDEFSFVPNNIANKVFESIYPVISSSKKSKFIIVSTPNGADPSNLYYNLWQQANQKTYDKNKEGWKPFRIDWWDVPGRDARWKDMTLASIGAKRFAQEFGNEFLASGTSRKLVPDDIIEKYRMELSKMKAQGVKPVEQQILSEDEQRIYKFFMWKGFDKSRTYAAAADTAEGVGGDSSVLYVFDVTDLRHIELCAKFSTNDVSLVEFAFVCSKVLALYGSPPLFAERNGVSAGMLDSLRITYKYQNIARESKNGEAGVYSHVTVKSRACLWARDMMTTMGFGFVLPDQALMDELGTFVKKENSGRHSVFQAAAGSHDDHIMTFIWLCWGLSKELVDKYFVVVETFESQLGELLPRTLLPLNPYSGGQIKEISTDPLYRRFQEIKNECLSAYEQAVDAERNAGNADLFQWSRPRQQYFEDEWIGPSWNGGGDVRPQPASVNPNNVMPAFFVG